MAAIEIEGVDRLVKKLGMLGAQDILVTPMNEAVVQLQGDMKEYPPAIPESKYARTEKLGQAWTRRVTRVSGGVVGKVGNNRVYAPFVQSSMFQAAVHVGRWTTDAQALERRRAWIVERFQRRIRQALEA